MIKVTSRPRDEGRLLLATNPYLWSMGWGEGAAYSFTVKYSAYKFVSKLS